MPSAKSTAAKKAPPSASDAAPPPWKVDLLELLDRKTPVPLVEQLRKGVITEDVELFLNLGITSGGLGALAGLINKIVKAHSSKAKKKFITMAELQLCETLSDVIKLVGSRM